MAKPFIEALVAKLLPRSLADSDQNTRRRARLVVLFSFTIFLCGPGYGAIYLLLGMHVSALGAAVAAVVLFATPFVQRRTGSVALGAHLVTAGCYAALALVTAPTGGIAAPAVAWLALVPVTALMLGGKRAGKTWTAISLLTVAVYFALDTTGLTPGSEVPAHWLRTLRLFVNAGLIGLIALLAWLYESNKDLMLSKLQAANAELALARDEAETAHREARLVLDNVAEGLLLADRDGRLHGERSRSAVAILGALDGAERIWDVFSRENPGFAASLALGWEAVFENILPIEVTLDQMPKSCRFGERTLSLQYVPVESDGTTFEQMLVVVTDFTQQAKALEAESGRREQLDVLRWVMQDGAFFASSYRELLRLADALEGDVLPWLDRLRLLHTLKGSAGMLGLASLARHCHQLEQQLRDCAQTSLSDEQRKALSAASRSAKALIEPLLGVCHGDVIVVERSEYESFLEALVKRAKDLHAHMLRWSWESSAVCLDRLAQQARVLAERMPDREVRVVVEDEGTLLPPQDWAPFWSSAAHLLRNAIDHGIEPPEERIALGKPAAGTLFLRAVLERDTVRIDVEDDGRGIDWERVRERALELGLPVNGLHDLEQALFADGFSTRAVVSELSGRGVGMSAVLASCRSLGGSVTIRSAPQQGTCVSFAIPISTRSVAA